MRLTRSERVCLAAVFLLLVTLALRQTGSPDLGFHLATGRQILAEKAVPRFDTFTYTINDHAYIDTSWGYDVIVTLVHAAAGIPGVVIFHAVCFVLAFAISVRSARLEPSRPIVFMGAALLGVLLSESRLEARPEAVSYVLFASILHLLHRRALGLTARTWLLVPLFLLWSNLHGIYLVGWGALACFNVGAWIRNRTIDWKLLGWSMVAAMAAFLNPYGWRGPAFALSLGTRLSGGNIFHETIGEFESPLRTLISPEFGFYLVPTVSLLLFIMLAMASVPHLWRTRRFELGLLLAVFVPLALNMVRNTPLLAIAGLPAASLAFAPRRAAGEPSQGVVAARRLGRRWGSVSRWLSLGAGCLVTLFALRVVTDAYYVERRRLERFGWTWNHLRLPVGAAEYANRVRPPGRMLNDLNDGGYLIHALPQPVFIDGRLELVGEAFYRTYRNTFTKPDALSSTVDTYGVGWILFPYRDRPEVLRMLSQDVAWTLTCVDGLTAVFVKSDVMTPALRDKSVLETPPPLRMDSIPGLRGMPRVAGFRKWWEGFFRRQSYPVTPYSLGVFHYLRGDWSGLACWTAEALRQSEGAYGELYGNLGAALHALGYLEDARACFLIAIEEVPLFKPQERARLAEALAALQKELENHPRRH